MTQNDPRWSQIRALFEALIERPAAERESLIVGSGLDATAQDELRSLLQHHDQHATGFLGVPAQPLAAPDDDLPSQAATAGQRLGAWEIVRRVGQGGMGEVFEARRADGSFEGRAAVKLLKRGMDSAAVLQRFAQERQALARLNHPHIARLLDAGASADGLPYFVMEFVQGRPIHLATTGQPLEHRLRLFLQLADAVSYAHRNLLVHRDLKPSNVLVDGEGQVKLLDFGIAKALDPLEGDGGDTTVGGQRPFTPNYASPEQVRGEPVSTSTDIYSLGVLLYQMLTGARPTGRQATTPQDAMRAVLEEEPTRPSRLSEAETQDPHWLATRKRLEGDLDHILLMALEKTSARRYATVDALVADVQAFLQGRPVGARAASPLYVLAKFVRRNRWPVLAGLVGGTGLVFGLAATLLQGRAAASLGVLGLAGGLGMALVQGQRAAAARDRAQAHLSEARAIASDVMVRHADAVHHLPGGAALKAEVLNNLIGHLDRLAAQTSNDATSSGDLAMAYARLAHLLSDRLLATQGHELLAEQHARRSLPLFEAGESAHAGNPWFYIWWARAWRTRVAAEQARDDLTAALQAADHEAAIAQRGLQRHPEQGDLLSELGSAHVVRGHLCSTWSLTHLNQHEAALASFEQARVIYQGMVARGTATAEDLHQLGTIAGASMMVCFDLDRKEDAVRHGEAAMRQRQANVDAHPDHVAYRNGLATEANNFSYLLNALGQFQHALVCAQTADAALLQLEQADPQHAPWREIRLRASLHQARALTGLGRPAEALPLLQVLCDPATQVAAAGGPWRVAWARLEMAHALRDLDRHGQALAQVEQALPVLDAAAQANPGDPHLVLQAQRGHRLLAALLSAGANPAAEHPRSPPA